MEFNIGENNPLNFNINNGQGGAVNSVNGKIGDVVLNYSDVGALSANTPIPTVDVDKQYVDQHDDAIISALNTAKEEFEQELDSKASTTYVQNQLAHKQDLLTAGENISIVDNVISATGSGTPELWYFSKRNQTTGQMITDALNAGKLPVYYSGAIFAVYNGKDSLASYHNFVRWNMINRVYEMYSIAVDDDHHQWFITEGSLPPNVPTDTKNYVLKCIAGSMQWVEET